MNSDHLNLASLEKALPVHRNSVVTAQTQDEEELQRFNRSARNSIKEVESWRSKAGYYDKTASDGHIKLVEKGIPGKDYPPLPPITGESAQQYVDRIFKQCTRRSFTAVIGLQQVFWTELRQYLLSKLNFQGLPLVAAFRLAARSIVFPAESIEKERLIEALADEYHSQNPNMFESAMISRNIFFASMVCNTILWNKNAKKLHNRQANLRCMFWDMLERDDPEIRGKVSESLVLQIYGDVKKRPIAGLSESDGDVLMVTYEKSDLVDDAVVESNIKYYSDSVVVDGQETQFDFDTARQRAPIKTEEVKSVDKATQATLQAWKSVVENKNGLMSKVSKLGFFIDTRSVTVAGGHSTLQSVESGLLKSATISARSRSVSPIKETLPVILEEEESQVHNNDNLYTFQAPLIGNVGGHSNHPFCLSESSLYHQYQDPNCCLSSPLFNVAMYVSQLNKISQVVTTDSCVFESKSKMVVGDHILTDILAEVDVLRSLQKWHSITNNESTQDVPIIMFHGPLLKNSQFKLESLPKLQFGKKWLSLYAMITLNRQGTQLRLYDETSINGVLEWIQVYRKVVQEDGLAYLRPSGISHLSHLVDENKVQQLQKTAMNLPPFPKATKIMNLDGSLVYAENNWQNSDVLTYVQSEGSWFTQFLTPDKIGLLRPSPIEGSKLPLGDSGTKFAQNAMQGLHFWQNTTQTMIKSQQTANYQFLFSELAHWQFHLGLTSALGTIHRDIKILLSGCQNSWSGVQAHVRKLCQKNMDTLHSLAVSRNSERRCLMNSTTTSLTFEDSPALDSQDNLVIEKSTQFDHIVKNWSEVLYLGANCNFDPLLLEVVRNLIKTAEANDHVPFWLHLALLKIIMYQYSQQMTQARLQVVNITQKLNQVELSIVAQDFAFDEDTFEPSSHGGSNYAQSIRSRMTRMSSISFKPGFKRPSVAPSVNLPGKSKLFGTIKQKPGIPPMMPGHAHPQVAVMSMKSAKSHMSQMVKNFFGGKASSTLQEAQHLEVQLEAARVAAEKFKSYTNHLEKVIQALSSFLTD